MHLLVEDYLPNDDKTKNVYVKQERGGRQNLFRGYALQGGRRPKAKIRHIQYPKPNYKH